MEKEKVISLVRKLLALAENKGATEAERENAMRKALALLAQHNLTRDHVKEDEEDRYVNGDWSTITYGRAWCRQVCKSVAELYFCRYYFSQRGGGRTVHHFVGRSTNALVAQTIAHSICSTIKRTGLATYKDDYRNQTQFFAGAMEIIQLRCMAMIREAKQNGLEGAGTGLMLIDAYRKEKEGAEKFLAETGVSLISSKGRMRTDEDAPGFGYGQHVGSKLSLRPEVTETKQKALGHSKG